MLVLRGVPRNLDPHSAAPCVWVSVEATGGQVRVALRDTSAGLIVAMMAIPMAMGFAMASGLRRTIRAARGASPTVSVTPMASHAVRHPRSTLREARRRDVGRRRPTISASRR